MTDQVTETFDLPEWEAREVFLKFGEAVYSCQALELTLTTYAQWIRRFKLGRPLTDHELQTLRNRLLKATFGQNYGEVTDLLDKQWNLSQQMKDAVGLRNELVHHWWRLRPNGMETHDSRRDMLSELNAACQQLQSMADVLIERVRAFLRAAGVHEAQILAELQKLSEA